MSVGKQTNKTKQRSDFKPALISWVLSLALGLVYVFTTPLWQAPDEPSHLAYIEHMARHTGLPSPLTARIPEPIQRQAGKLLGWPHLSAALPDRPKVLPAEEFAFRGLVYTANHPPLYYLAALPLAQLGSRASDRPVTGMAYGARVFSALLTSFTVLLAYYISRAMDIAPANSLLVACLLFLQPQFMFIATSINNDALTIMLFSLLIFLLVAEVKSRPRRNHLLIGTVIGLGLLTKVTFFLALPISWLAFRLAVFDRKTRPAGRRRALAATLIGLLISGWWYAINYVRYGSPWYVIGGMGLGSASLAEFFSRSRFYEWLFKSYWGFFGWMSKPLPDIFFYIAGGLSAAAAVGVALTLLAKRTPAPAWYRRALVLLITVPVTLFLGAVWFRIVAKTGQGRYLFPAIVPTTLLLWVGVSFWTGGRFKSWAAHALLLFFSSITVYGLALIRQLR